MRKVYCYAEKEEKPEEIDHSGDIVQDLSSLDISDLKNRSFFFIGGEIIENPYYEPSEYMKRVYAAIDAQYEKFYRSDKDKKDSDEKDDVKDAEEETNEQSSDDEMPDWIAEMPYGELIKKFPGGISEALEYAKKEKGLSVPEVHYDSPEPEKLGVKAFTKNAEVYLAPGEGEETLKHELGHVIQQKNEKIPATTKIGEQQVNLDPKFEQKADEIARHIEDYIPELISEKSTNTETKDVIQFELPEREELWRQIEAHAENMGISTDFINQELVKSAIMNKVEEYYKSFMWWAWWGMTYKNDNYLDTCIIWGLNSIKSENSEECNLYSELEKSKPENNGEEEARITEIMDMLSTEKIFLQDGMPAHILHIIMQWLTPEQCGEIKNCILKLKNLCDSKGVISVLQGANENASPYRVMLDSYTPESEKIHLTEYFVKRLEQMRTYIERVSQERDSDGKTFGEKYWIRSTGSDPHKDGEHALFFVNKENQQGHEEDPRKKAGEIACVYKAHDLKPDAAVVGEAGMFQKTNELIKTEFEQKSAELGLNLNGNLDALATMAITTDVHTEELVIKKGKMNPDEAKLYFFRGGILKALTDAMAVIDLHGDNIMPTGNGPMIIDAEINFFHYGTDSCLVGAFGESLIGDRPPVSLFTIAGGGSDGKDISSADAFKDTNSDYRKIYEQGYGFMVEQMRSKQEAFKAAFEEQLRKVDKVRILPLATSDFAGNLQSVITNPELKNEIANDLSEQIKIELTKKDAKFLNSKITNVELNDEDLKSALLTTFEKGTIPAMYADMDGNIYLDDKKVGEIRLKKGETVIDGAIGKEKLIETMKNCFQKKIKKMFNSYEPDYLSLSQLFQNM